MRPVHLAILIHGLQGNPGNVAQAKIELIKAHEAYESTQKEEDRLQLVVCDPKGLSGVLTFDGIELGAVRVAQEV